MSADRVFFALLQEQRDDAKQADALIEQLAAHLERMRARDDALTFVLKAKAKAGEPTEDAAKQIAMFNRALWPVVGFHLRMWPAKREFRPFLSPNDARWARFAPNFLAMDEGAR